MSPPSFNDNLCEMTPEFLEFAAGSANYPLSFPLTVPEAASSFSQQHSNYLSPLIPMLCLTLIIINMGENNNRFFTGGLKRKFPKW